MIAMPRTKIAGIGMYVPPNVVTNNDLLKYMDTSDEWIQERTGIKERRYADRTGETTTTMGVEAARLLLKEQALLHRILTSSFLPHYVPIIIFPVVVYCCNGL